ncbi:TetR/AcrR family transcriptional regulator [Homoserinibacter sp. YIM 151385]|uniref:TetR/AcrR family transcriptional regulator n=1 Tax=Homoserinibacter sp. YIM 151385 TaxID=2985506 RepID=UPI0022F06300|nr:TetR/AcrR family transcriptional regulator [Homoserinibacter sp. YIM 151385]WBU38161.1 TetR/AcrR family transcriptional regulator [Homoserinibacter sp. YIM 151385]
MHQASPDHAAILDAAADVVVNDGMESVTLGVIAHRAGIDVDQLLERFGSIEQLLVAMLNREYAEMYTGIVDNIDRDPRGGLLSRIYFYTLTGVYERPLARALYVTDPAALNRIMRTVHGLQYLPNTGIRSDFVERMIEAGMARNVDARTVSAMMTTVSAGLAITSPTEDFDLVAKGIEYVLSQLVDAEVEDTQPGKIVFFEYATALASNRI